MDRVEVGCREEEDAVPEGGVNLTDFFQADSIGRGVSRRVEAVVEDTGDDWTGVVWASLVR